MKTATLNLKLHGKTQWTGTDRASAVEALKAAGFVRPTREMIRVLGIANYVYVHPKGFLANVVCQTPGKDQYGVEIFSSRYALRILERMAELQQ